MYDWKKRSSLDRTLNSLNIESASKHQKSDSHRNTKKRNKKKEKSYVITSWGKYGVIKEEDLKNKQQEFNLWLLEVKGINFETLPLWGEKQYFAEFIEDYNTATFPHKKYYNLEKWEKKHVKKLKRYKPAMLDLIHSDETARQVELAQLRSDKKKQEIESTLNVIRSDSSKIEAMRQQKMLVAQMENLFRMGCIKEAQQLQDKLMDFRDAKPNPFNTFEEEDREAFVTYN